MGAGYTFFWIGRSKDKRHEARVGFAVKSDLVSKLSVYTAATEEVYPATRRHQDWFDENYACIQAPLAGGETLSLQSHTQ